MARVYSKADIMNRRRERWSRALAILSALLALVTGLATIFLTKGSIADFPPGVSSITVRSAGDHNAAANVAIREQLNALRREVSALQTQKSSAGPASIQLARLDATVADLSRRQKRIEDAILNDPVRALEVPLLRRDVENNKESQAQAIQSIGQRLDQVFDLNKWLLGAGALSLLGIALSTLLSHWKGRGPD